MEVCVVSKTGIPESSILSIRAGSVKRQAPTSSEKPFRFSKGETKDNLLKFDILQCVGTGYAVLKPFEDRYKVVLSGSESQNDMTCEVDIKHVGADASPAKEEKKPDDGAQTTSAFSVQNAQSYLDDHGVLQFIQGMIQALVKERPSDPYKYMGRHILNGYDVAGNPASGDDGAPPQPTRVKSKEMAVHEQAREALSKLSTSDGIGALTKAFPGSTPKAPPAALPEAAPVEEEGAAKCAPPAEDAQTNEIDSLRMKAKGLLVQGFHSGTLEQTLATSNDQKVVDDLRQKAKGLFVTGFYSGDLESTLVKIHSQDKPASPAGEQGDASKPAETDPAPAEGAAEAAGEAKPEETKEEQQVVEDAKSEEKPAEEAAEKAADEANAESKEEAPAAGDN